MNRIVTAVMFSGLLVAAPAFAKTVDHKSVATAGDKSAATDTKSETAAPADASAKPVKKSSKKSKKATTETKTDAPAPAEAPAK